jgi:hypothetical protein
VEIVFSNLICELLKSKREITAVRGTIPLKNENLRRDR